MEPKLFAATKAFIVKDGKVLILREASAYKDGSNAGKFDVPGGRVKPGQHFLDSLKREIAEETGMEVKIGRPFFMNEWRPVVKGEAWHIVGTFFECRADSADVQLSEDHESFLWIDPRDYRQYELIENLHPAFEEFIKLKRGDPGAADQ